MSIIGQQADVPTNEDFSDGLHTEDAVADAFLARLLPKEGDEDASSDKQKPSDTKGKKETEKASDENADDENDQADEQSDESPDGEDGAENSDTDDEQKAKKYVEIDDNTFVKIKVGDDEIEVPVKDLTRVHGQEAALTRKSQEVADARKKANDETAKAVATLDVLVKRAREQAAPYAQLDFLALAKDPNVSAEDLTNLRSAAQAHFDNVRFLEGEIGNFMTAVQARQKEDFTKAAKSCVEKLSTPGTDEQPNPHYIKDWNNQVYDDIRSFAVSSGLDQETVNQLVDPAALKLIHMAMLFKNGASKVQTVKVNKTPKKIVKTTTSPTASKGAPNKAARDKSMQTLREKQTVDAAGEAFLARLTKDSDD
jgi:hypothetical protein